MAIATEAQRTLAFHGVASPLIADVGVAGLWRLLDRIAEIAAWRVAIVVAGMEGALFGVVAALVRFSGRASKGHAARLKFALSPCYMMTSMLLCRCPALHGGDTCAGDMS